MSEIVLHRLPITAGQKLLGFDVDLPIFATIGARGEEMIAMGGLTWGGGRCWLWFHTVTPEASGRFKIVSEARRMLRKARQLGETEVYTVRDPEFATSSRLLKLFGFEAYAIEHGQEVYVCRV